MMPLELFCYHSNFLNLHSSVISWKLIKDTQEFLWNETNPSTLFKYNETYMNSKFQKY